MKLKRALAQQQSDQMLAENDAHYISIIKDLIEKVRISEPTFIMTPHMYEHKH